jgi:hypothetical protein
MVEIPQRGGTWYDFCGGSTDVLVGKVLSDHYNNSLMFVDFRLFDGNPPAPTAAIHYIDAMCIAMWYESTNGTSISMLLWGGGDFFHLKKS